MAFKSETVEAFIAEAERELVEILRQKTELKEREIELEALIKKCKTLFGGDHRQQSLPLELPTPTRPKPKAKGRRKRKKKAAPLWQLVEGLYKEKGLLEMEFQQIRQIAVEREWIYDDAAGTKILYRAMENKAKKGEVFVHTGRGTWTLKEQTM
ncbi:MAG: hypothetical protein WA974_17015 [Thermodesulfobacteriota bacterium]